MAHALAARASSLGASVLLMGGVVLAALTMTYTVQELESALPPRPVEMLEPPEPLAPPQRPVSRPLPPLDAAPELSPLAPSEPISTIEPLLPYAGPVAPAGPVEITAPRWLQRPRDLARYYPRRAIERTIEGEVLLDCLVSTIGMLDCRVLSETPGGWGFAEAALRIAGDHRMAPAVAAGQAVEGRYRMRVPFEIE
jgi:protein TonB